MPDDWFEDWFGEEYLALYEHRDHHEARAVVALIVAARAEDRTAPLVRADMRELPFASGSFALVVNLFTSFGYFRDDAQHLRVVGEVGRVVQPGGWFVLDYLHASQVRGSLVHRDERTVGTVTVEQEREISSDGRFVRKTITIGDLGRTFVERVRLFEPSDLAALCTSAGFVVESVVGNCDGSALRDDSPRTILFARRR
jgi:SAM-dependent methyltransferase